jgi:outer membrane protein TolC
METTKTTAMVGVGAGIGNAAVISVNDAIFAPLSARQFVRSREAEIQAATNDSFLAVTEAYFTVQQARGELAGAIDATARTVELVRRTEKLAAGLISPVEVVRAQTELTRRQQAELTARERWRIASADLLRVLDLPANVQIEPLELPHLKITLLDSNAALDELLETAFTHRPELASQQALVQASVAQLKQERFRPFVPSLIVSGTSTSPAGTLGYGLFGGGPGGSLSNFGSRLDVDVQLLWQLDNLGFGNRARINQRQAENLLAQVEFARLRDRVAAEVSQALAQTQLAAERRDIAERGLRLAIESAEMNLVGVGQTKRVGEFVTLIIRPQEAVAAVQALGQAYVDYYGAVADSNRAQFRLYRALGQPAEWLLGNEKVGNCAAPAALPAPNSDCR